MTNFLTSHRPTRGQRRPRTTVLASALVLTAVVGAAACTKTVTVSDNPARTGAGSTTSAAGTTPPASPTATSSPAGNNALQVVDSTATQNGKSGNGGTVVGAAVQETPSVWVQLSAVQSKQLGQHLININEATLYRFDKDTAKPSASNCTGDCAATWPPVTIRQGGNAYLAGVDPQQIGAIRRPDGQIQLTVGGWPIYRFAHDTKPGDAKGQGVGGTWFAVSPTGEKSKP